MRGKLEICPVWGKLQIKSLGENKRNRGNHGIIAFNFITFYHSLLIDISVNFRKESPGKKCYNTRLLLIFIFVFKLILTFTK